MTFISHKRRKSELILEVAAEGGAAGGFEGLDVLIRQAVHDAAVQADVAECFGVVQETHVLEVPEEHAEDQALQVSLWINSLLQAVG